MLTSLFNWFKPAPPTPRLPPAEVARLYPRYRWRIFESAFIANLLKAAAEGFKGRITSSLKFPFIHGQNRVPRSGPWGKKGSRGQVTGSRVIVA
jgi:hypothetical protein